MVFLERCLQNSQENACVRDSFLIKGCKKETLAQVFSCEFCKISRTPVLQNISGQLLPLFPATLLKWGTANSVLNNSDEYSLTRNINLRSTVQVYHCFLGSLNFQRKFSSVYTVYCQKQPPE